MEMQWKLNFNNTGAEKSTTKMRNSNFDGGDSSEYIFTFEIVEEMM
jgi:hypothetical protein